MRWLIVAICLALASWSGLAAPPAGAASLCAGSTPGCFPTIQAALNAAHDGDVITIGPGTFAGGFTIDVSVTIIGAGAGKTIIQGGGNGPVVQIGLFPAPSEPTVSLSGVTITGGSNSSTFDSTDPRGGGILVVPSSADPSGIGATVSIRDSVITGNSVAPTTTDSCGAGCTFSTSAAGGIFNGGAMTLIDTTVSNNTVTVPNSAAVFNALYGGGILNRIGSTLTLQGCTITGNTLTFGPSNTAGVNAFGGGINTVGALTVEGSTISNNSVSGVSTNPDADILGIGGGLYIDVPAAATIQGSQISGNSVSMTGPAQGFGAGGGGIDDDGSLVLATSTVSNNRTTLTYTSSTAPTNAGADAGGMEVDGTVTIANTTFDGNSASATSPVATVAGGPGGGGGALFLASQSPVSITNSVFTNNNARGATASGAVTADGGAIINVSAGPVSIANSVFSNNSAVANAGSGAADVSGGAIVNGGTLTLSHSTLSQNSGTATAPSGTAQGGGIWNGDTGNGPPVLTLLYGTITHNSLARTSGVTIQGGGLYTTAPVTLTNSVIAQNTPDQCFGC